MTEKIKKKTNLRQNFTITPEGKLIGPDGKVPQPRENITPAILPEKRKRHKPRIPTWKNGTIFDKQQQRNETYIKKNRIA